MNTITFQVIEGVDRGKTFRDLPVPLTIGREEGNLVRLNDERVSRFHAKIQQDNGDIILTDLESTNHTWVNGNMVQIRRLRVGDRICVGRSMLLFGSDQEIQARLSTLAGVTEPQEQVQGGGSYVTQSQATIRAQPFPSPFENDLDFDLNLKEEVTAAGGNLFIGNRALPPLPQKLTPAQAARLAEILDFLHRGLTSATEIIQANDDGTQVTLTYPDWQRILAVEMLLARYLRAVAEPDSLGS